MTDQNDPNFSKQGEDFYIVVDVETAGPTPGAHALLSIGACTLGEPRQTFYVELQPDAEELAEDAMQIHKLSFDALRREGLPPKQALTQFASWIDHVRPENSKAVFTAFNAPFDWMFIQHYFHKYLGFNPFGHKALDIKAYYMGVYGVSWSETSHNTVSAKLTHNRQLPHHAMQDAIMEAELFELILAESLRKAHKEPDHEGTEQPT